MVKELKQFSFSPEVRVVEASAGSGKTYCLARRYVQLLLNPRLAAGQIILRNILAITFTNKAAYAMKARILEFLKKIALGTMSAAEVEDILTPIGLSLAQAQPAAVQVMDMLIHQYNFFQVQTIDSFINALLSGCAFKIGLSAGFKIKRNYSEYLERSFDRMIEEATSNKKTEDILARFLYQYLFLENKNGWFPKEDMLDLLNALYSQSNTYGRDFMVLGGGYSCSEPLAVRKKKILVLLKQLQGILPEKTHKKFAQGLADFLEQYQEGFDFDRVSDYLSWENVPVAKGGGISSQLDQLWGQIQTQLCELSEFEAVSLFDPYVEVFNYIDREFHMQAAKDDVLFLPELNRRARDLFDDGKVSVEELYYRLATRFNHYLLDEFQDTSRLQWQNLELMIEEALSIGGTFFYVGDKKQAIYGFRGGEVKLFDEVKDRFAAFNVQVEMLGTNYRSEKAIVDLNNQVFSPQNLRRFILHLQEEKMDAAPLSADDICEVENIFHASQQKVGQGRGGGYVRIEYIQPKDKEESNDEIRLRLLALIENLKGRFTYSQIAVLTRSNVEIEQVTSWLMAQGISVESERTLNIKQNPLILEMVAFLRFLDSPVDDLSFAQFISGEVFSKVSGLAKEAIHSFLFAQRLRREDKKEFYLYRAFRDCYPYVWEKFCSDFFRSVGLFPLYELSASLFCRLEVYTNFPYDHGFFLRFLELVKEKEDEFSDLNSFLEYFGSLESEELFVNVVNSDAIKVLTVHKAKGLEFPVVIIPFLGMKVHSASGGGLGQQSYIVDPSEHNLKLLRIKKKYLKFSQKLFEIDRGQRVRSFISELNNIYVALTRAGQELYAFIPAKIGASRNLVMGLIPDEFLAIGNLSGDAGVQLQKKESCLDFPATEKKKGQELLRLPGEVAGEHDWIEFLKEEFAGASSVLRRQEIRRGIIFHDLLSRVRNLYQADKAQVMRRLFDEIQMQYPQHSDWHNYEADLKRILETDALQDFFIVPDGQIILEKDLVDSAGQTRRIDRLIIKKEEMWIVDYKSSREGREKYLDQVKEYMSLVGQIHPEKRIKGFLLYLVDAGFEEIS